MVGLDAHPDHILDTIKDHFSMNIHYKPSQASLCHHQIPILTRIIPDLTVSFFLR